MKSELQIALVLILVGFGYTAYEFYDFYSEAVPRMEDARQAAEVEVTKKQSELRALQEFARNIETIKQELRELNLQLESALEHMPRTFNLSGLLRKLTMLAQNSGLELYTFKPKVEEERVQGAFYSQIGIEFDLRGTFTQTLLFFDQVSRLKRIVNLENLQMATDMTAPRRSGSVVINTAAAVKTYRFSE